MTARRTSRVAAARARRDLDRDREQERAPSIAEIAALTGRLAHLSSGAATDAERVAFLADKHALLARIPHPDRKD